VRAEGRVFLYLEDRELALGTLNDNTMMFLVDDVLVRARELEADQPQELKTH